jgi:hypothetical protein
LEAEKWPLTIFGVGKFRDGSNKTEVSPIRNFLSKPCEMQISTSILNAYDESGRTATQSWLILIRENLANMILGLPSGMIKYKTKPRLYLRDILVVTFWLHMSHCDVLAIRHSSRRLLVVETLDIAYHL